MDNELLLMGLSLIASILGLGIAFLMQIARERAQKLEPEKAAMAEKYIEILERRAQTYVDEQEQEFVKKIKEDPNREWTEDLGASIRKTVVDKLQKDLTEGMKEVLSTVTTDVNKYTESLVSQAVLNNRQIEKAGQPSIGLGVVECERE